MERSLKGARRFLEQAASTRCIFCRLCLFLSFKFVARVPRVVAVVFVVVFLQADTSGNYTLLLITKYALRGCHIGRARLRRARPSIVCTAKWLAWRSPFRRAGRARRRPGCGARSGRSRLWPCPLGSRSTAKWPLGGAPARLLRLLRAWWLWAAWTHRARSRAIGR